MLKLRHHVASQRIQDFLEMFFKVFKYKWGIKWRARKWIHYLLEDGIEKSVPRNYQLSSLRKPCDARARFFYPTLILMIVSYTISSLFCLFDLNLYFPVNSILIMLGQVFLGSTSTKQGCMCLAHGHYTVPPVRLEPATHQSKVKHSTIEPLSSLSAVSEKYLKSN